MTNSDTTRVVFIQVNDATSKVRHLAEIVQYHFSRKEHFLIIADDDKALAFVDELLWNHTPDIFIPHAIVSGERHTQAQSHPFRGGGAEEESPLIQGEVLQTQEWIALTKEKKNINNARFVFNLCSTPLMIDGHFRIIYDFDDGCSPNKKNLSALRFDAYKKAQFLIESRTS